MKSLALRVLSDFGVDGIEPQALGSRKGRLALCVLALAEGQVVPADVLVDTLWGDTPPAQPEDQLAVLVSRLRSVLGRDRIQHRDRGYLLVCDWLDASELAALTQEMDRRRGAGNVLGAAAAARIALSLLRGYGLPSVPGEWAQLRLAELDRLAGRARRVAATALFEAGDWMAAADAATAALAADGYDEESLRVLLRAYVAGGQVAAALAAYARARERLAAELGTDPSPQTAALYTAILRGEVPAPPPVPARHPAGLVGRDDELAYLDTIAGRPRDGPTELVVVDGEAGIGKTALLRAWAAQRAAAGDTVLLASCGQLDRAMPLDALLAALAALLRRLGPDATADLLGPDAVTLTALLGAAPAGPRPARNAANAGSEQILADGMLGPAVLYAALARACPARCASTSCTSGPRATRCS
ncbi:MAG TPA: BTAD domain-containing putative transcriptional regulator [Streptosporangiaceae bacterium]|nr:BTAD domain-containing putative transcriptional regulator [Streptosporangiaceae bacterium]